MVNFNQFLKQAQGMQKKMQELQDTLATTEYQGRAGANLVNVTLSGKGDLKKIEIDKVLLIPEEKEILEDLILAAFNDAKRKVDEDSQNSMSGAFGNMGLPPGLKMPF